MFFFPASKTIVGCSHAANSLESLDMNPNLRKKLKLPTLDIEYVFCVDYWFYHSFPV